MTITRLVATAALALGLALAPGGAGAFQGGAKVTGPGAEDYAAGKKAVKSGDYQAAVPLLAKAVAANPRIADAHNLLGYSYRKLGDVEAAFRHYGSALELDPEHRGANEYIGELYLETGNLAKAEEHLDVLDGACFFGCAEYTDLKEAVTAYKASQGG